MFKKKKRYKIIRHFFNADIPSETIKKRLTKAEAMAICQDPEMQSRTCTSIAGKRRTEIYGGWFHGFDAY